MCALPNKKIFHNAQYDVGWLQQMGIQVNGQIIDTMIRRVSLTKIDGLTVMH